MSDDTGIEKLEQLRARAIPNSPVQLVPTKSDAELAEEFKKKVAEAYQPLIAVLDEYDKHGLNMQASVGKNAFGKFQIVQLIVMKQF